MGQTKRTKQFYVVTKVMAVLIVPLAIFIYRSTRWSGASDISAQRSIRLIEVRAPSQELNLIANVKPPLSRSIAVSCASVTTQNLELRVSKNGCGCADVLLSGNSIGPSDIVPLRHGQEMMFTAMIAEPQVTRSIKLMFEAMESNAGATPAIDRKVIDLSFLVHPEWSTDKSSISIVAESGEVVERIIHLKQLAYLKPNVKVVVARPSPELQELLATSVTNMVTELRPDGLYCNKYDIHLSLSPSEHTSGMRVQSHIDLMADDFVCQTVSCAVMGTDALIAPSSIDFGDIPKGEMRRRRFAIADVCGNPFTLSKTNLDGSEFEVTWGVTKLPSPSMVLEVQLTPSTEGEISYRMHMETDTGKHCFIMLTGRGVQ